MDLEELQRLLAEPVFNLYNSCFQDRQAELLSPSTTSTNNCVQPGTSQDSSINSGNIPENTFKVKNYYYDNVDVEDGPPPPKRRKLQ